jgi:hypothetical protein
VPYLPLVALSQKGFADRLRILASVANWLTQTSRLILVWQYSLALTLRHMQHTANSLDSCCGWQIALKAIPHVFTSRDSAIQ